MADFQTEFAVSMTCDACVQDVRNVLKQQVGVERYDIDLSEQRVVVTGKAPPSQISRALKDTGRQVIVRGAGTASGQHAGAAVCIFEAYTPPSSSPRPEVWSQQVHGMARMVQTSEDENGVCVVDLTIRHDELVKRAREAPGGGGTLEALMGGNEGKVFPPVAAGAGAGLEVDEMKRFLVYVAKSGDISQGARSAGGIQRVLGEVEVNPMTGYGDLFVEIPRLKVWEMIGHAMVVAPLLSSDSSAEPKIGPGILAGVIARSAGAWGNDKKVCACSGQTMWEENRMSIQANL